MMTPYRFCGLLHDTLNANRQLVEQQEPKG